MFLLIIITIQTLFDTCVFAAPANESCFICHNLKNLSKKLTLTKTKNYFVSKDEFSKSVHNLLKCIDCHKDIKELPHKPVLEETTCTTACHMEEGSQKIFKHQKSNSEFENSIHNKKSPYHPKCQTCHTTHSVKKVENITKIEKVEICLNCHDKPEVIKNFNFTNQRDTYFSSFHGEALLYGNNSVPTCQDCHNQHSIQSAVDFPQKTYGMCSTNECHPNANQRFTKYGKIHHAYTGYEKTIYDYVKLIYIVLIVGTIGFMLVHNILDFFRVYPEAKALRSHPIKEQRYFLRYNLNERLQHIFMFTSFILLTITGFMLKLSPDLLPYRELGFEIRGIVHRFAAIVLVLVSVYHVFYLVFTKSGRNFIYHMMPRFRDLKEFIQNMLYLTHISNKRPKFDHFNYAEKMEYYALVWGTFVMTATGVVMWLEKEFPFFLFDVSHIIHLYEATLAALAIIVWHFYLVHLRPGKFPMSKTWIHGKISEHEMMEEHESEHERIN